MKDQRQLIEETKLLNGLLLIMNDLEKDNVSPSTIVSDLHKNVSNLAKEVMQHMTVVNNGKFPLIHGLNANFISINSYKSMASLCAILDNLSLLKDIDDIVINKADALLRIAGYNNSSNIQEYIHRLYYRIGFMGIDSADIHKNKLFIDALIDFIRESMKFGRKDIIFDGLDKLYTLFIRDMKELLEEYNEEVLLTATSNVLEFIEDEGNYYHEKEAMVIITHLQTIPGRLKNKEIDYNELSHEYDQMDTADYNDMRRLFGELLPIYNAMGHR